MPGKRTASKLVTIGGPVGLALGILLGALANYGSAPWVAKALPFFEPLGRLWMNALSVSVVPLTVCLLVVAVCSFPKQKGIGRVGALTFGWFLALLIGGAILAVVATKAYLVASPPAHIALSYEDKLPSTGEDNADWTAQILPSNLFASAAKGDILPIAVLAVLFGLALRALPDERRKPVEALFVGIRDAVMLFVRWVMCAVPVGAFALILSATTESGLETAGVMLQFVVYVSALLGAIALVLCTAIVVASRARVQRALGALSPLVAVAVGTRSSLASLPTLIESAQDLGLHGQTSEIVLPASVSVFKMNRTISATAKMLFLAAATGVVVGPQALIVFLGTIVLLSFATPGLPAGGSNMSWGAYVAAGVPIEAVVLFEAVDAPTDFAKTALNVVADFAVAVFVSRSLTQTRTSSTPSTVSEEPTG